MNIKMSLALQVHGLYKRLGLPVPKLFHPALLHAVEHHIIFYYVLLIHHVK